MTAHVAKKYDFIILRIVRCRLAKTTLIPLKIPAEWLWRHLLTASNAVPMEKSKRVNRGFQNGWLGLKLGKPIGFLGV